MSKFPKIMGILNVTPDSFSDGGKYFAAESAVQQAFAMLEQGVDIIDIGGESTRPGAAAVSENDELQRVIPVIESIKEEYPEAVISIDSTKYNVVEQALKAGASMINDVSGLDYDEKLAELAVVHDAAMVLMHMQGTPRTMQHNPHYNNVTEDVFRILSEKIQKARSFGAREIIADVGIGFGKTVEHNLELLKNHDRFCDLGVPLLLGLSRKSFIGKILDIEDPEQRDLPTVIIHAVLLSKKVDIIRIHNAEMMSMLKRIFLLLSK